MKRVIGTTLALALCMATSSAQADKPSKAKGLERVKQELVKPPLVPAHSQVAEGGPKIVEVRLEVREQKMVIDNVGTEVQALTFEGSVPGPLIVVHQDDYVELTIVNPKTWGDGGVNIMSHNIDLHAVTGALGGAGMTLVKPGEQATIRFKATKPGVFVYHCAPGGVMIPYHVVAGMNGAIMVLPRDGLKDRDGKALRYDKAYYIGEQDFYVPKDEGGSYKKYAEAASAMPETLEVMKTNEPSHVVFNGAVGALTGPLTNLETWFIAGGSAGAALYDFLQPGLYVYLNHNLIDAVLKGAAAHVKVEGEWDNDLLEQVVEVGPIE
jgi:nitrite reductase (NO-forming)